MTGRDKINKEALEVLRKNNYNGCMLISTGAGKAKIIIDAAKEIKPNNILYLCDNEELRDKTFPHELHKWDAAYLLNYMDLACYQTAYKWSGKNYDLLLADEFDYSLTPKYSQVYFNNTFDKKILVSATLEESKIPLAKKIAPIIYERTQQDLIEQKVLNKVQPFYINYDLSPDENRRYLNYNERFAKLLNTTQTKTVQNSLNFLKIQRKQFLSSLNSNVQVAKWLLKTLSVNNEKILMFCGLSEQADKIHYNTYHSNNNNVDALRKFEEDKENILIVIEKITRGINVNGVKNVIHESPTRAKTKIIQKTGRGMRLNVNEILNLFFFIPYYRHPFYGRRPTVVKEWVEFSTKDMDMTNVKNINYTI